MKQPLQHNLFGPPDPASGHSKRRARKRTVITYSALRTYLECRRRYYQRYVKGLVPIQRAHALRFGSVTHDWLESWHRGRTLDKAQAVIDRAYVNRDADPREKYDWHRQTAMLIAYAKYFEDDDFEVLELEKEFAGRLVNPTTNWSSHSFEVRGKIDGIVRSGDQHLLLEHKTAASISGDYLERLAMDLQILLYAHYAREALDYPVTGILYNVLVKPKLVQAEGETEAQYQARCAELIAKSKTGKTSAKRKMPETDQAFQERLAAWFATEPRFTRVELLLDFDSIANVRQQIWDIGKEILDVRRSNRWHQNSSACFGFGTCPYWAICSSKNNPSVIENEYRVEPPHAELSADDAPAF